MRSNYKQRIREAKVPHVAFVKHNLRATVTEEEAAALAPKDQEGIIHV